MSQGPAAYRFAREPAQRRITIASSPGLTLEEVIRHLETETARVENAPSSPASPELAAALEDLRAQSRDPELRTTAIAGRDARIGSFVLSQDELTQMGRIPRDRWSRFVSYRYRFKIYPRRQILGDFPIVLCVEPTSICNLRCQMCFQSDRSFSADKAFLGRMDMGLFRRIVDEMEQNRCDSLVIASRGEPTLHPGFPEMLKYATARVLDVKVNTNATRLDEKLCREILEAEPNVVVFSIDSADPAQYEEIRKGARFPQVLENVRRFRDIRERDFPRCRTTTRVSGTLFRDDQEEGAIRSFWSEYVDQVALHGAWPFWDSYSAPLSDVTAPCGVLWERMYIWWDGLCNPCDIDYKSWLALGRVDDKTTVKEIWLGAEAQRQRQLHQTARKNSLQPCNRCSGIT